MPLCLCVDGWFPHTGNFRLPALDKHTSQEPPRAIGRGWDVPPDSSRPLGNLDVHMRRLQSYCLIKLLLCSRVDFIFLFCEKWQNKAIWQVWKCIWKNRISSRVLKEIFFSPLNATLILGGALHSPFKNRTTGNHQNIALKKIRKKEFWSNGYWQRALDPIFLHPACVQNPYASSPESHREKRPRPLSWTSSPLCLLLLLYICCGCQSFPFVLWHLCLNGLFWNGGLCLRCGTPSGRGVPSSSALGQQGQSHLKSESSY